MNKLIFLVGLTAVGKSSSINALKAHNYLLLPNRRELTDLIIIPEIQKDLGQKIVPLNDRLKRFDFSAKYRQKHPGGIVYALQQYLRNKEPASYIFDNIRGENEIKAAHDNFDNAAFIFLDAPFDVRLQRLIGRSDSFDKVGKISRQSGLVAELNAIAGADKIFDLEELSRRGFERDKLLTAVSIIAKEQQNYDSEAAKEFLFSLEKKKYIYIDTSKNSIAKVKVLIERFLDGNN